MIRNLEHKPDWRMDYNDNKQVKGGMREGRIGPKNQLASLDSQFRPLGTDNFLRI
jgi:hypothetical protein